MAIKIIATYGPALKESIAMERVLMHADIMRINFSHMGEADCLDAVSRIRTASKNIGRKIRLFADLPGPKMRVSRLSDPIPAEKGAVLSIMYYKDLNGSKNCIPIDADIYDDIIPGSLISIGDGIPRLAVTGKLGREILCRVVYGGSIACRKGVNVQGSPMKAEPPTNEDILIAGFAARNGFDHIGLSFVKAGIDVDRIRGHAGSAGVISKIERPEALENIDWIAEKSDMIMVARGDLALNIGVPAVPAAQKRIIDSAKAHGKPVIVATQLLGSMTSSPIPTRAEASDIAYAIEQGADYLMLSDETAIGRYPAESVEMLYEIAAAQKV